MEDDVDDGPFDLNGSGGLLKDALKVRGEERLRERRARAGTLEQDFLDEVGEEAGRVVGASVKDGEDEGEEGILSTENGREVGREIAKPSFVGRRGCQDNVLPDVLKGVGRGNLDGGRRLAEEVDLGLECARVTGDR
jgi:hypothetical protein